MPAIIIPRTHLRQPQGRAQIDYANPLTAGLAFAETPTSESGRFGRSGAVAEAAGAGGRAYSLNGSSYLRDSNSPLRNFPLTFLALFKRTPGTLGSLVSIGAGSQRHLMYFLGDGRCKIFSGTSGATNENGGGVAPLDAEPGPSWLAARVLANNSRDIWHAGALLDSASGTVNTTDAANALIGTYWNDDAPALTFSGEIYFAAAWARALANEELREMYRNPWQLFRADPIRIYSLPTGAISINSITASSITQTGARITLGLTR